MKGLNVPMMIASLGLSIVLWMFVYAQNTTMTPVAFAVKLNEQGLEPNGMLTVTEMDEIFRFTAIGPEERLQKLRSDPSLAAYVDLSNAQPGRRRYPVRIFPEAIEEYATNKNLSTLVTIEPVDAKTVMVEVEGQGQLRDTKLRLTGTDVDPSSVIVRGARSAVSRATKARVRLDLATVDTAASKSYTLSVDVLDDQGRTLPQDLMRTDPLFVRVTPLLTVAPESKTVFVIVRFKGEVAPGYVSQSYVVEPKQVVLQGPSLALAAISKLQTEPIDIGGLTQTTTLPAKLVIPTGLSVPKGQETVRVRVLVTPATVPDHP